MEEQTPCDIVVHNGTVLTVNDRFDVLDKGLVCIAHGKVTAVETLRPNQSLPPARQTIDAGGGIIMPGLVNTHTHAPMTLFRGLADDVPLMTWLYDFMFKAEKRWLTPENVYNAAILSCAEMLLSGTTTCCDGYFLEDTVAGAVEKSGMRAILGQGIVDFPAPGVPDPKQNVVAARGFIEKWQEKAPLISPGLFCHSPYACSEETLTKARIAADKTGTLFQIHVAETQAEVKEIQEKHGLSPVQYLDSLGILNENTLAVHVIWVDKQDMDILAQRHVGLSVTTESEMKLASGVAPVPEFLKRELTVGIGTDGCASNNNLDMFEEMDFLAKLHKVIHLDPVALEARQVLMLATRGGAAAIGLGDRIGSLEAGKAADLLVIDTHKPHLIPMYDPASHLVYSANGSDVRDVIIDGKVVVKDRVLITMEIDAVMETLKRLTREIASSFKT
jgi:5-methylthioadenosine/S-adenosylhomocysteine deaminase